MASLKFFLKRIGQTIFLLWLVLTFLFFFFRLLPGDFTTQMVFSGASPEVIAAVEERWGLNDPLYIQYWNYLTNFVMLDIGDSTQYKIPVWDHVNTRIFNTFILAAPGITLAYIIGSLFGIFAGTNRGSRLEQWGIVPIILIGTLPAFFLSILLIMIFASNLGWFPTSGIITPGTAGDYDLWWEQYFTTDFLMHYILPFSAVFLRYLFIPSLIMRTSVVEVLGQDFITYQRLTGIPKRKRLKHLTRHSMLPVITLYPVSMTRALGGLVLIEMVFNWPGIGFTLVEAVLARDYPTVQFVFFVVAAFVIISNFVIDVIYGVIDPRISVED